MQVRRGNKIVKESSFIPTQRFIDELMEYSNILNPKNGSIDVYLSTDGQTIIKEIELNYIIVILNILLYHISIKVILLKVI